jgi:hypothetical protein
MLREGLIDIETFPEVSGALPERLRPAVTFLYFFRRYAIQNTEDMKDALINVGQMKITSRAQLLKFPLHDRL